jgi:NAD(P)-dependent dehydrogenase (short-subunit alcohol dehydrogenase family)
VTLSLLAGRRVLLTGGASGIGLAVVHCFAAMGAIGVVLDLTGPIGPTCPWPVLAVDVTDEAAVAAAVGGAVDRLGGLDAVVAAAGIVPPWQQPAELDLSVLDRVLAVNVRGVAATIKHTAPALTFGGTICVIGSVNSWRGDPNIGAYAASKHAVLGLVRSAAIALGPNGIRVNAVGPGPVATEALLDRMRFRANATGTSVELALQQAAAGAVLGRIATAEQVADTVAFLTSDLSAGITGQLIAVDGGIL